MSFCKSKSTTIFAHVLYSSLTNHTKHTIGTFVATWCACPCVGCRFGFMRGLPIFTALRGAFQSATYGLYTYTTLYTYKTHNPHESRGGGGSQRAFYSHYSPHIYIHSFAREVMLAGTVVGKGKCGHLWAQRGSGLRVENEFNCVDWRRPCDVGFKREVGRFGGRKSGTTLLGRKSHTMDEPWPMRGFYEALSRRAYLKQLKRMYSFLGFYITI